MAGIYIHIPFCKQACHYCNFYFTTNLKNVEASVHSMRRELKIRKEYLGKQTISTIYFGGGTPSMLHPSQIQQLIETVREHYLLEEHVEITLEANPDNLDATYLKELADTEVNRFSIGIQSFNDAELKWMNRAHNQQEALECLDLCRDFGYSNFSIDLIFGIPISNTDIWTSNLNQALRLKPHHISCYALTVEENTALDHFVKAGKTPAVVDKDQREQFYLGHDILEAHGYDHYEISNYALQGHASKHNSSYWEGVHYLGIGPGAHSYNGISRSWNVAHLIQYMKAIEENRLPLESEILDLKDQYNEWVMTSIRKKVGIDISLLGEMFSVFKSHFYNMLEEIPSSYIVRDSKGIRLSKEGMIFADFVGSALFKTD